MSETPRNPTRGWLYSECDRRGLSVRGTEITEAEMRRLLEGFGLKFSAGREDKNPEAVER